MGAREALRTSPRESKHETRDESNRDLQIRTASPGKDQVKQAEK